MKIRLFSDLHLEFYKEQTDLGLSFDGCDVFVLAGDIHYKGRAVKWIKEFFPKDRPVLMVLGNHDAYKKALPKVIDSLKEEAKGTNVHVLENDVFEFNGVNFLGATLWTDYELFNEVSLTMSECHSQMSDFRQIRTFPGYHKLRPVHLAQFHHKSKDWLRSELTKRQGQKNVVVTHHSPSPYSLLEEDKGQYVSAAYASNLHSFMEELRPDYWLHGHTHESFKYWIGETQVLTNPKGYPGEENSAFDPGFTIEV